MTANELIVALAKLPPEAKNKPVLFYPHRSGYPNGYVLNVDYDNEWELVMLYQVEP